MWLRTLVPVVLCSTLGDAALDDPLLADKGYNLGNLSQNRANYNDSESRQFLVCSEK